MIYAYDKGYLGNAMLNLSRMMDFAVYDLKYDIAEFFQMFLDSGIAELFGHGDCHYIAGMSGIELAYEVLEEHGVTKRVEPSISFERSPEYWVG